jgi:SNF2 family DNA or RNA helicase
MRRAHTPVAPEARSRTRACQVLRPFMLRRTKAEVETELPGKSEHVVRCGLSAWQRLWYRQITEEGRVGVGGRGGRSLQNAAMHLRKARPGCAPGEGACWAEGLAGWWVAGCGLARVGQA